MNDRLKGTKTTSFTSSKSNDRGNVINNEYDDYIEENEIDLDVEYKKNLLEEVESLYGFKLDLFNIEELEFLKESALNVIKDNRGMFLEALPMDLMLRVSSSPMLEDEPVQLKPQKTKEKNIKNNSNQFIWNKDFDVIKNIECPGVIIDIDAPTNSNAREFVDDLIGMYSKYANDNRLKLSLIEDSPKKLLIDIEGDKAFSLFKYEKGMHCIKTNSEKTDLMVSVLPKKDPGDYTIKINESDLKFEAYRSGGAGGQHVNKTSSAVRITHIPTGIVVTCQAERSQFQNKAKALEMLQNKLEAMAEEKRLSEIQMSRLEGYSDQKIRTYDLNSNTLIDHRINFKTGIEQGISKLNMDKIVSKLNAACETEIKPRQEIR